MASFGKGSIKFAHQHSNASQLYMPPTHCRCSLPPRCPENTTPSRAPLMGGMHHQNKVVNCAFWPGQRERSARRAAPHHFHGAPSSTKLSMNNMEWTFSGSYQEIPQILPFFDQCNFGASLRSKTSKYGGLTLRRPRSG